MASSDPPRAGDREVLSSLPNARPQRRSAKRAGRAKPATSRAAAQPTPAAAKAKPTRAAAKPPAPRGAAAKTKPTRAAQPRAKAAKPPPVPPAGYATPHTADEGPHGTGLLATAVEAAAELAQIGIAAGGRALKSALQRLPRP
jgi:hypothetical protein